MIKITLPNASIKKVESRMECVVCGAKMKIFSSSNYILERKYPKSISINFNYCKKCNTFCRFINSKDLKTHLKHASYTNLENELWLYQRRKGYFSYIYTLATNYHTSIENWLDFGCSYGHLLDLLKEKNIKGFGIESTKKVLDYTKNKKKLNVYETIDLLPRNIQFDIITTIDSFYYLSNPVKTIQQFHKLLLPNGKLIIRVTNRNWLPKLRCFFFKKNIGETLGDASVSYSKKSMSILLEKNGFNIIKISGIEKNKKPIHEKNTKRIFLSLFYFLTTLIYIMSFKKINLTPGLIFIAEKK